VEVVQAKAEWDPEKGPTGQEKQREWNEEQIANHHKFDKFVHSVNQLIYFFHLNKFYLFTLTLNC
jgi:hypothetical protein